MLKRFSVTNFKGFKDRIELDLSFHKNYEFNNFAIKNDIIKDCIIYGPNGCGKSNIGFALFDIVNHLTQKMKYPQAYDHAIYVGNPNGLMKFEYCFDLDGKELLYKYAKNSKNELIEESLSYNGKEVFSRAPEFFSINKEEYAISTDVEESFRSSNVSVIGFLLASFPVPQDHYLIKLKRFVDSMLWFRCLEDRGFIGLKTQPQVLDEFIIENNLVEDFEKFLFEVSSQKFSFVTPQKGDKFLQCTIEGKTTLFRNIVSTGTSSLELLYYWMKNLNQVSLLFIDEFDAFYHFKLSSEVCKRLFSLDCQVILTSHNTYLMSNDLLRPDCNLIIDGKTIRPLCNCTDKELRWSHNIEKLFRGGAFDQ